MWTNICHIQIPVAIEINLKLINYSIQCASESVAWTYFFLTYLYIIHLTYTFDTLPTTKLNDNFLYKKKKHKCIACNFEWIIIINEHICGWKIGSSRITSLTYNIIWISKRKYKIGFEVDFTSCRSFPVCETLFEHNFMADIAFSVQNTHIGRYKLNSVLSNTSKNKTCGRGEWSRSSKAIENIFGILWRHIKLVLGVS